MQLEVVRLVKNSLYIVVLLGLLCSCNSSVQVTDLRCEYRKNPLGIDNVNPRLSWKIKDWNNTRGQKQQAYQILVASSAKLLNSNKGDLWDSGQINDSESVNIIYAGTSLLSGQQCYWKLRIWDATGQVSDWSRSAYFTMGLLQATDWTGDWIMKEDQHKKDHNWYRKTFTISEKATSAFVYLASFGYHELYVNGEKITDNCMNPVSSYMKKRIPYLSYNITDKLNPGDNVIAVWHAAGWARWRRVREYRNIPFVFKAQVELTLGEKELSFSTDKTWKCKKSHSEYYGDWDILRFGGETIDDRLLEQNWNAVSYDDSNWSKAIVYSAAEQNAKLHDGPNISFAVNSNKDRTLRAEYSDINVELSAQMVEPQVKFKTVKPTAIKKNSNGTYCIDMGVNYTGFFEMNLYNGAEGDSVLFEIADQLGETSTWKQKSKYIYGKSGKGQFTNRFNLAGGRWITIYGLSYKPNLDDIKGYVITSDRKQISKFNSSNELLNQIYQINLDTYIANTIDGILVDCPHRERRGWGEVTVAAMYGDALPNFESGAYMDQYTQYMRDAQARDGGIRGVINEEDRLFLMWKANNPITVWETYRMLGDKKILEDNYDSMQKWMTWLYEHSNYETGGALKIGKQGSREFPGLGDWCTPRGNFWTSSNSPEAAHFNNCVYAYMLKNAVGIASALGKTEDAKLYADRLKVQQEATHRIAYNPETGLYVDGLQVDQAFALISGVTPNDEVTKVYDNLVDNVLYKFPYYDTGSSGQALYTRYFTECGERMDLVYELLKDSRHPSYGYFIRQGKTVWPERWSAIGNSQIHTCYTGIGGYFIKGFGGIRPDTADLGMRNFIIKPAIVGDLNYVNTEFQSMYGNIVVNWLKSDNKASVNIEVPVNSTAKVYIPALEKKYITEGGVLAEEAKGITYIGSEKSDAVGNYIVFHVESGVYHFEVNQLPNTLYPSPLEKVDNLSKIARMSASSMFIEDEKLPGFEAFKANDGNTETAWQANESSKEWLEASWHTPQTISETIISEKGANISSYQLQYWDGETWKNIVTGDSCGAHKQHVFKPVTTTKCRLYFTQATNNVFISEFEIY
ncbi:family 78 glycoside hydrolase catalytic domain [Saccharicrinis aurantiacus]|uniref:family 78 glycoside hydrolase catalytic domain n=1 Tax=Saccharicrinis aurantiacus TaxID=1849719 RepID=UPI002492251D|nr:family 78 glycoside hydrolase catalytic domain [Saccharicrinis aurantiacus]